MRYVKKLSLLIGVMFVSSTLFAESSGQIAGVEELSMSFRGVVEKVKPAVVYIEVVKENEADLLGGRAKSSGSGVIIDAETGIVLTANHVVENTSQVTVGLSDGRSFKATDIRKDPQTDVAIVKIEPNKLPEAQLGDSNKLEVGDWVLAIGSPFGRGLENSVSAGIVSAKGRKTGILGNLGLEDYIQTDAVINKGNSGGPLVDIHGKVVGINSTIISSTGMYAGLGFAIPSNLIKPVVVKLIEEGKVVRGWLGVTINSLKNAKEMGQIPQEKIGSLPDELIARGGAYVVDVMAGGPAEQGGIRKGDIILQVDGRKVTDSGELVQIVSSKAPGTFAVCRIWRGGKHLDVKVELGQRPERLAPEESEVTGGPREQTEAYKKLGITVSDFTGLIAERMGLAELKAVIVDRVKPGSLAEQFGIERDNIITEVNGRKVENSEDFDKRIAEADLRTGINLTILTALGEQKVIIKSGAD